MAWHAAWDAEKVFVGGYDPVGAVELPSVKHLLADLCNAFQERNRLIRQGELEFVTFTGDVVDVSPSDYVGMPLSIFSGVGVDLQEVLEDLVAKLDDFLGSRLDTGVGVVFTDSTFATRYTLASLMAEIDLLTWEEVMDVQNWRSMDWWRTIRGVLERIRYCEQAADILSLDYGDWISESPSPFDVVPLQTVWGAMSVPGSASPQYSIRVGYHVMSSRSAISEFNPDPVLKGVDCWARESVDIEWDSDYRLTGTPPAPELLPFPSDKALCSAEHTRVTFIAKAFIDWGGPGLTSSEPNPDALAIDATLAAHTFEAAPPSSWTTSLPGPASRSFDEIIELGPDGTEALALSLPATVPPGYCDDYGSEHEFWYSLEPFTIYLRFDLNAQYDYPAA